MRMIEFAAIVSFGLILISEMIGGKEGINPVVT